MGKALFDGLRRRLDPSASRGAELVTGWYWLLFAAAVSGHAYLVYSHWWDPLIDHHEFRQTQTAFSVWSILEGGSWITYETPVLGKPWAIPFEFPLYQWLVAATVSITGLPIDQSGRMVSVVAFYLLLVVIHELSGQIAAGAERLIPVMLMLLSPLYIFWTRTFMIESTALLLAVSFFAGMIAFARRPAVSTASVALLTGLAAALVKVTTFAVACVPVFAAVVLLSREELVAGRRRRAAAILSGAFVIGAIPMAASFSWNAYTDRIKRLNPMADGFLTTESLGPWLFGTIEQKTSWDTWSTMMERSIPEIGGGPAMIGFLTPLLLVGAVAFFSRRFRLAAAVCVVSFVAGPAVFTNLYAVHSYYFYANGIYLLILGALGIFALLESGGRALRMTRFLLLPLLLFGLYASYSWTPYSSNREIVQQQVLLLGSAIDRVTESDEVLAVYGWDWNPVIPYYARRRAFMDRWDMPVDHPRFQRAMAALDGSVIGAMLVTGAQSRNEQFIRDHTEYFGLRRQPVLRSWLGDLYVKERSPAADPVTGH